MFRESLTIEQLVREAAAQRPDRVALLAQDQAPLSYAELLGQLERMRSSLAAFGIGGSDRVAIVLAEGPELAVAFLGVAAMAAAAPLNPAYKAHEFATYLTDLQPKALLLEAGSKSPARGVAASLGIAIIELHAEAKSAAGLFTLASDRAGLGNTPLPIAQGAQLALLLHTSGTTSRPKMVPLTQAQLCHSATEIARSLELRPGDRCLNAMPLFHVHGLIGALLSSLAAGASVVSMPGFTPSRFFTLLGSMAPTWYTAVPTMHGAIVHAAAQHVDVVARHRLRFIRSCSSALPQALMHSLEKTFRVPVLQAYGMTEASHQIACNPLPPGARKPGSVGLPTGVEVAILGEAGNCLGRGAVGDIVIAGPAVTHGYLGVAKEDQPLVDGRWFRTGDVGWLDPQGYLFIHARRKEIINRGGEKISPIEVEEALLLHPAVEQAVAFAIADEQLGEEVGAAVVLRRAADTTEAALREFAATRLAHFKVPCRVAIVSEIPRGPTGKPQRIGLADALGMTAREHGSSRTSVPFVAARSDLETMLADFWCQLLRVERVGIYDNFFAAGGSSLLTFQLLALIEAGIGVKLPLGTVFEAPTIAELVECIAQSGGESAAPPIFTIQPAGSLPPFFCVGAGPRFWSLAHRLGTDRPFLGLPVIDARAMPHPCSLADIALCHVRKIRTVQPKGPYVIGGWSLSGVVAFEIAQQLRAAGERVQLLVLFDTLNPAHLARFGAIERVVARFYIPLQKTWFHLRIMRGLGLRAAPGYLQERAETIWIAARRKYWRVRDGMRQGLQIKVNPARRDAEEVRRLAAARYDPQPYDGRVLLFRRALRPLGRYQDPTLGWGEVIRGELEIHEVPGDHVDMFNPPHVAITADRLKASLSQLTGAPTVCEPVEEMGVGLAAK